MNWYFCGASMQCLTFLYDLYIFLYSHVGVKLLNSSVHSQSTEIFEQSSNLEHECPQEMTDVVFS